MFNMRAKYVFERFTEESDPIDDMGIGMDEVIKDWFIKKQKEDKLHRVPNLNDAESVLHYLVLLDGPKEYIQYILKHKNYNETEVLNRVFGNPEKSNKKYIDLLLSKGAKFEDLKHKVRYVEKFGGKETSLSPTEKMIAAFNLGDLPTIKKLLKSGEKITIGMINFLFKHDPSWPALYLNSQNYYEDWQKMYDKLKYDKEEIIKYLTDNQDKLEDILHHKDLKKLEKIKSLLRIKISTKRMEYPRGYKIYRILKFINETHPSQRKDITKFIVELTFGKNTFNPLTQSSYWSDGFQTLINPRTEIRNGKYFLNAAGKKAFAKMEDKFKSMNIEAPV